MAKRSTSTSGQRGSALSVNTDSSPRSGSPDSVMRSIAFMSASPPVGAFSRLMHQAMDPFALDGQHTDGQTDGHTDGQTDAHTLAEMHAQALTEKKTDAIAHLAEKKEAWGSGATTASSTAATDTEQTETKATTGRISIVVDRPAADSKTQQTQQTQQHDAADTESKPVSTHTQTHAEPSQSSAHSAATSHPETATTTTTTTTAATSTHATTVAATADVMLDATSTHVFSRRKSKTHSRNPSGSGAAFGVAELGTALNPANPLMTATAVHGQAVTVTTAATSTTVMIESSGSSASGRASVSGADTTSKSASRRPSSAAGGDVLSHVAGVSRLF